MFAKVNTPAVTEETSPLGTTDVATLPTPTKMFPVVRVVPNLPLNVEKSELAKYPSVVLLALIIEIAGVEEPVATLIGAVAVTFVTVPPNPVAEPIFTQDTPSE